MQVCSLWPITRLKHPPGRHRARERECVTARFSNQEHPIMNLESQSLLFHTAHIISIFRLSVHD